jgi:hypothetical protein
LNRREIVEAPAWLMQEAGRGSRNVDWLGWLRDFKRLRWALGLALERQQTGIAMESAAGEQTKTALPRGDSGTSRW